MVTHTSAHRPARRRLVISQMSALLLCLAIISAAWILRGSMVRDGSERDAIDDQRPHKGLDLVYVPVPRSSVSAGTLLDTIEWSEAAYLAESLPDDVVRTVTEVRGTRAKTDLPRNLPLVRSNYRVEANPRNALIERIPDGMRAMTIRVDETSAIEGWLMSGAVVDMILVRDEHTSVVAEKIRVLSVERSVAPAEEGEQDVVAQRIPSTITILVSQTQCLAITTAIPLGKISLVLRGNNDTAAWGPLQFDARQLMGARGDSPPAGRGSVKGYVTVRTPHKDTVDRGEGRQTSYALLDDKWIPTSVVPQGFLVARERDAAH